MSTSTEKVAFIGLVVAAYGAILSSINSLLQYLAHKRESADVVVIARTNMSTNRGRYAGMKMTIVTATNRGKRPVTIAGFAVRQLDRTTHILFVDVRPPTPVLINEAQSVSAYVDESTGNLEHVESYYSWDTANREFHKYVAPWYRRIWSRFRRRFMPADKKLSPEPPEPSLDV